MPQYTVPVYRYGTGRIGTGRFSKALDAALRNL
jgi:hypothetical protein